MHGNLNTFTNEGKVRTGSRSGPTAVPVRVAPPAAAVPRKRAESGPAHDPARLQFMTRWPSPLQSSLNRTYLYLFENKSRSNGINSRQEGGKDRNGSQSDTSTAARQGGPLAANVPARINTNQYTFTFKKSTGYGARNLCRAQDMMDMKRRINHDHARENWIIHT